jgi:hypothetical protein
MSLEFGRIVQHVNPIFKKSIICEQNKKGPVRHLGTLLGFKTMGNRA